jgi:hypothetical protein
MKQKRWRQWMTVFAAVLFCISVGLAGNGYAQNPAAKGTESGEVEIKGQVKAVSNKAKTVSVDVTGKGVVLVKFTDDTTFVNAESGKDIGPPTAVVISYKTVGPDKIATRITKALVKLPAGVTEIKTDELAALVAKGSAAGSYCLIDSRPAKVASAELIPTAASIPVTVMEEKGEKSLACGKAKVVIFYCGGPT